MNREMKRYKNNLYWFYLILIIIISVILYRQDEEVIIDVDCNCNCINTGIVIDTGDLEVAIEEPKKYLDLFGDGRQDDLYCVTDIIESKGGYIELEGYYLTIDGIKKRVVQVADVWLEEEAGGYGCLEANMKIGYCSYLPMISMLDKKPGVVGGNISQGSYSDLERERYYAGRGKYLYCDLLTEEQKYNSKYKIDNVMKVFYN